MLQLELARVDYHLVGLTKKKCMKLLPADANSSQKIAIGDSEGVLHVFGMKRGDIQMSFKTSPGPPISSLDLGGQTGGPVDRIFASVGNEVRGYTKKGKQFLLFDTNVVDNINIISVQGSDLFVCGPHNLNHFQDCKEMSTFPCGDKITDMVTVDHNKMGHFLVILACEDKVIRIIDGPRLIHSVPLSSLPTVLSQLSNDHVLCGTADGGVSILHFTRYEVVVKWILEPKPDDIEVTALCVYDLIGNGKPQVIVGRDDGNIEVYSYPMEGEDCKMMFQYCCNESITSLDAGRVGSPDHDEIVVITFSGWVFGLSSEVADKNVSISTDLQHVRLSEEARQKVNRLREEIDELEEKILREREKYQTMSADSEIAMSAIPLIAINDKFFLNKDDASYNLSLEVQMSIDNVLIQSDVPIDLLDVQKNSAVVSFSDCAPMDGNFLLATYRCQLNTTRLELKLRTIEGQYGVVRAYVTPNMQPKCCQVREFQVKPLSLHARVHEVEATRPYNVLTLKGAFSLGEIHSWVEQCLPEVPAKTPSEPQQLFYVSTFLGTMLHVSYCKGEAEFRSDNVSTVSILKDVLSKEATRSSKKRPIDISWNINENSIPHTLSLIHPKLTRQLELQRLATIIEAMAEVEIESGLTDEYAQILGREEEILQEFKKQPAYLDRLYGMITDLYIDVFKFQGTQVKNRIPTLLDMLSAEKYSYEGLLQFFYS